mgnify:CR=1 FL=1
MHFLFEYSDLIERSSYHDNKERNWGGKERGCMEGGDSKKLNKSVVKELAIFSN